MPKLSTEQIVVKNAVGDTVPLTVETSVSAHGEFRVRIPSHLLTDEAFGPCLAAAQAAAKEAGNLCAVQTLRDHTYLTGRVLEPLVPILRDAVGRWMQVETTTDLVILYHPSYRVFFCRARDGSLHGNGNTAGYRSGEKCDWSDEAVFGARQGSGGPHFSVGLWARAYRRTIETRGENTVTTYSSPSSEDADSPALARLQAFVTYHTPEPVRTGPGARSFTTRRFGHDPIEGFRVMPYTEEAAAFFADTLTAMCVLADRMHAFMGEPAALQLAIEQRAGLLEGPR